MKKKKKNPAAVILGTMGGNATKNKYKSVGMRLIKQGKSPKKADMVAVELSTF